MFTYLFRKLWAGRVGQGGGGEENEGGRLAEVLSPVLTHQFCQLLEEIRALFQRITGLFHLN